MTVDKAQTFFSLWDFSLWLFILMVLAYVIVLLDLVLSSKRKDAEAEIENKNLTIGKFFYFLFFLKFSKNERYKHRPQVVQLLIDIFPLLLLLFVLRGFFFDLNHIPSNSMMPTLLTGDKIVINKFAYGLKLPITNTKLIEFSAPERGDIVVFRYPNYEKNPAYSGTTFIKRIVALPGDKISYTRDRLMINGKTIDYSNIGIYKGVDSGFAMNNYRLVREKTKGANHYILLHPLSYSSELSEATVPEDHYFVMGDNRANSSDSRFWGYVPEAYILGKAVGIVLHLDWDFKSMQFSRIGRL